jgi:uncharacterized protein YjbI with pentapeptide repeats
MLYYVTTPQREAMKSPTRHGVQPPQLPKSLRAETLAAIEDHGEYTALALVDCDLTLQAATNVIFEQAQIRRSSLARTRLAQLRLIDVRLEACDCSGADWEKVRVRRAEISGGRLLGMQLLEADLENVLVRDCNFADAVCAAAKLKDVRFEKCDLHSVSFEQAELSGVVFHQCDLSGADLRGAKLREVDLRGAIIDGMQVGAKELRGAIIDRMQAVQVAGLLGITVKERDEE